MGQNARLAHPACGAVGRYRLLWAVLGALSGEPLSAQAAPPPTAQNPSPMVERTRQHERLMPIVLAGTTRALVGPLGKPVELWVPPKAGRSGTVDLVIHFHGAAWLPQQAVAGLKAPTVAAVLNLGAGSGVYDRSYRDPAAYDSLVAGIQAAVREVLGTSATIRRITLSGFSAGHGAIRQILRHHAERIDAVLLLDGMHTSYVPEGQPLASGSTLDTTNLTAFADYAREAVAGRRRFLVTHSEIFPGTFASTTETADWLVVAVGVPRTPVLRWGPRGLQQLSVAQRGRFTVQGYAGNSAPDHIDQFHAMPELLRQLWK